MDRDDSGFRNIHEAPSQAASTYFSKPRPRPRPGLTIDLGSGHSLLKSQASSHHASNLLIISNGVDQSNRDLNNQNLSGPHSPPS